MKNLRKIWDAAEIALIIALVLTTILIFTVADADTIAPGITNVSSSNITDQSTIITWQTNESSKTIINYGYAHDVHPFIYESETYNTEHALQLSDLLPQKLHYYRVISKDIAGNQRVSNEYTFTTLNDTNPPTLTNTITTPAGNYTPGKLYEFTTYWSDPSEAGTGYFESSFGNASMNQSGEWAFTHTSELGAGTYYWKMNVSDIHGNSAQTELQQYIIGKAEPDIDILLNSNNANITAAVNETITILAEASITEAVAELIIDDQITKINQTTTINTSFQSLGTHTITIRYNETQNYTAKQKTLYVTIQENSLEINTLKSEYSLGELAAYTLTFSQGSSIETEICGPIPEGGSGFVECYPKNLGTVTSPYAVTHRYTNKTGDYIITATANRNGQILQAETQYEVINSINLDVDGDTTILKGDSITLTAEPEGGLSPYTYLWNLHDKTTKTTQEITISYPSYGTYNENITVTDKYGNTAKKELQIKVKDWYNTIIEVKYDNKAISGAEVEIDGEQKLTDSTGKATFKLPEDEYTIKIDADGYKRISSGLTVEENETYTYNLEEETEKSSSSSSGIELQSPSNNQVITGTSVTFKAYIELEGECSLYLTEEGSEWSQELETFTINEAKTVTYTATVSSNKDYSWKIQCEDETSPTRTFTTRKESSLASAQENVVDAIEIREKLEEALNGFDKLNLQEKQAAEAMGLIKQAERALRDYDRLLRDINNIKYRTDLSDTEQAAKRDEYMGEINTIEKKTPASLTLQKTEEFIEYPKEESLEAIAAEYYDAKKLTGTLNKNRLKELQNSISVRTKFQLVTVTYIDGSSQEYTLITKQVTYSGEVDKLFILEYVPKDLAESTDEITQMTQAETIKKDALLKYQNPEQIIYYVEGHKELSAAQNAHTILFQESVFGAKGNAITGNVIFSNIKLDSSTSLIILVALILVAYLAYAYELPEKTITAISGKSNDKAINALLKIVDDAKKNLEQNDVQRANLIFKELRLKYENSKPQVQEKVYEESILLWKQINAKYFLQVFQEAEDHNSLQTNNIEQIQKVRRIFNELDEDLKQQLLDKAQRYL